MALVVEDGTGADPLANGFIAVADCDTHHSERGHAGWTGTNAVKEAAIINGADYLRYAFEWKPGWGPDNLDGTVPVEVVRANAELALLALSGELMPSQTGQKLASESVSVGGAVTRSRTFAGNGGYSTERRFPFIDRMLAKYATGGSSGVRSARIERA